jgi:hypothetical protein
MSFQRALEFIRYFNPKRRAYLVHIGAGDLAPGDPENHLTKKYPPKDPLKSPLTGEPYPVPLHHAQWQQIVTQVAKEHELPCRIIVARDGLVVTV